MIDAFDEFNATLYDISIAFYRGNVETASLLIHSLPMQQKIMENLLSQRLNTQGEYLYSSNLWLEVLNNPATSLNTHQKIVNAFAVMGNRGAVAFNLLQIQKLTGKHSDQLSKIEIEVREKYNISLGRYCEIENFFLEGVALTRRKKWEDSILVLLQVVSEIPDHVLAWGTMGIAEAYLGHKANAQNYFDTVVHFQPKCIEFSHYRDYIPLMDEGVPLDEKKLEEHDYDSLVTFLSDDETKGPV